MTTKWYALIFVIRYSWWWLDIPFDTILTWKAGDTITVCLHSPHSWYWYLDTLHSLLRYHCWLFSSRWPILTVHYILWLSGEEPPWGKRKHFLILSARCVIQLTAQAYNLTSSDWYFISLLADGRYSIPFMEASRQSQQWLKADTCWPAGSDPELNLTTH